ncbi:MAG: PqqD family protein [Spirochaetaceae bacterium]|jgi:hypothetical protein|nr:PqqD family protein [Spirochaetaceae bacterium]
MLDMKTFYKRNDTIVIRKLGGKQWALNMETGSEYVLNETAYDMLEVLSARHTTEELVSVIGGWYDAPTSVLTRDCEAWLQDALEKGLVDKT